MSNVILREAKDLIAEAISKVRRKGPKGRHVKAKAKGLEPTADATPATLRVAIRLLKLPLQLTR